MDLAFFQTSFFYILLAVFIAYSMLDSFDLGIGMMIPFTKDEQKKKLLFASITPFWDGNEVWLIIAGGLLLSVFSQAYSTIFSGFYIPVLLLMVAFIFRAMSIEFWHTAHRSKKIWEWTFFIGSALIVFVLCVALGNIVGGVPLDASFTFKGSLFSLFGIFPLTVAILGISISILQGLIFASKKISGFYTGVKNFTPIWSVVIIMIALMIIQLLFNKPQSLSNIQFWIFSTITIILFVNVRYFWKKNRLNAAFVFSSVTIAAVWLLLSSVHYPLLVLNSLSKDQSISISTGHADPKTLGIVFTISLIGIVIFTLLTFFNYKIFRGDVTGKEGYTTAKSEEITYDSSK